MSGDARVLTLASASPRRRELLDSIGVRFVVRPSPAEEPSARGESDPEDYVRRCAALKARAVAETTEGGLVLGSDTVVALASGRILGKPRDDAEAAEMLRELSGAQHRVWSGACLVNAGTGQEAVTAVATGVTFAELSDEFIDRYVATGEPLDKAGSYGAQGRMGSHVTRVDGSWTNVVGLPLEILPGLWRELGHELHDWQAW
ncbi:MAG: Maf family protein [Acidobacteriota bacterium]